MRQQTRIKKPPDHSLASSGVNVQLSVRRSALPLLLAALEMVCAAEGVGKVKVIVRGSSD